MNNVSFSKYGSVVHLRKPCRIPRANEARQNLEKAINREAEEA